MGTEKTASRMPECPIRHLGLQIEAREPAVIHSRTESGDADCIGLRCALYDVASDRCSLNTSLSSGLALYQAGFMNLRGLGDLTNRRLER